jgi:uncharacterized protein YifN (PemK superfamily)
MDPTLQINTQFPDNQIKNKCVSRNMTQQTRKRLDKTADKIGFRNNRFPPKIIAPYQRKKF